MAALLKLFSEPMTYPVKPEVTGDALRHYETVAKTLGFQPAELTQIQLVEYFAEQKIRLFDHDEVWTLLKAKREGIKNAKPWCWRTLRPSDIVTGYVWGQDPVCDGYYNGKNWECRPYERVIPLRVLERVAAMNEKFGDTVRFFVSEITGADLKPYFMVRPAACDPGPSEKYHRIFDCGDAPTEDI